MNIRTTSNKFEELRSELEVASKCSEVNVWYKK